MANETAKAAVKRLYVVKPTPVNGLTDPKTKLIRATSQAAALKHATAGQYEVEAATTEDVAQLYADGVRAEDAT